jgi:hypothetical protein
MTNPVNYRSRVRDIIHLVQINEGVHLSDKSHHDIFSNVYHAILEEHEMLRSSEEYWKAEYTELKKKRFPLKWNELRITLAQMHGKQLSADDVLDLMFRIDDEQRVR